jgi:hypothetical protein
MQWEISHPDRLVVIKAIGTVPVEEVEKCYDAMVVANATSYARLFDASGLKFRKHGTEEEFMRFGARMSAYAAEYTFGPIAFVCPTSEIRNLIERCLNLARANRPAKIFSSEKRARQWLDQQRAAPKP